MTYTLKPIPDTGSGQPIDVVDMKDGDIAVIVKWSQTKSYLGRVVQRYGELLVSIGLSSGQCFPTVFSTLSQLTIHGEYLVRLVGPGSYLRLDKGEGSTYYVL